LEFTLRPISLDDSIRYVFYISEFPDFSTARSIETNDDYERTFFYGPGDPSTVRRIFRADRLFPETVHYIWARAISVDNPENNSLSSPITMMTLPLVVPPSPAGLGLAGTWEVNIINLENDLELRRAAHDHMIISWLPLRGFPNIPDDDILPIDGIIEGAMGTEILGSPLIDYVYMVLFPDLVANRAYWVRARTIFSVHRDGVGGEITERISYEIQFADNISFMDAITVFVMPDASEITVGLHTRMTVSEWAGPLRFFTARHDGEFDGDVIAELFPLPERDFEIIYNPVTQQLTWRFRSRGVDQWGHQDNQVDQRFISRLIQNRNFYYVIDMTTHLGQPVSSRTVEIPYSIIQAFTQRGIDLIIIAGDTSYTFRPGFVNTPQNTGFGRDSRVQLNIRDLDANPLPAPRAYARQPQNLQVNVINPNSTNNLNILATPVTAAHSISPAMAMDFNIGAYVNTPTDNNWRRNGTSFDSFSGVVTTSTTHLGDFAAIATALPQQFNQNPAARDALHFVNSQIALADMEWFAPDTPINAQQINNFIIAIANRRQTVNVNQYIPHDTLLSLAAAQMLVPGAETVTRGDAIFALVRAYENRTGQRLAQPPLASSMFTDITAAATTAHQAALLRAESIGLLGWTSTQARPNDALTMGEAMQMIEIILRN